MKRPDAEMTEPTDETPLSLERYAEISAELDVGAERKALLAREAIPEARWARSQAHWLKRMAAEAETRRFPTTTKYQALFKAKRGVAEAKLRAARAERAKPPQPALAPVEAAAAELALPIDAPLPVLVVPEPPRVAPPAVVPALASKAGATIPAPPMPPAPVTAPMPPPAAAPMPPAHVAGPPTGVSATSPLAQIATATLGVGVAAPMAPPAGFAQRPAAAAAPAPAGHTVPDLGRTGIVDVSELLKKHVMPFQPEAAAADEDDEPPRTGVIDAAALLSKQATPFAAPEEVPPRRKRSGLDETAPLPRLDLGGKSMQATPFTSERPALPFRPEGRAPSSPVIPAVVPTPPPSAPAAAGRAPSSPSFPAVGAGAPVETKSLTIAAFASLTAELAESPHDADAIRRKYGVTEAAHQELSRTFTLAFQQDDALRQRYVAMVRQYRGYLQGAKR